MNCQPHVLYYYSCLKTKLSSRCDLHSYRRYPSPRYYQRRRQGSTYPRCFLLFDEVKKEKNFSRSSNHFPCVGSFENRQSKLRLWYARVSLTCLYIRSLLGSGIRVPTTWYELMRIKISLKHPPISHSSITNCPKYFVYPTNIYAAVSSLQFIHRDKPGAWQHQLHKILESSSHISRSVGHLSDKLSSTRF